MEEEIKHHHEIHESHHHPQEEIVRIPVRMLVSIAVIIAVLFLGFFVLKSGIVSNLFSGGDISEKEATAKLLNFFVTQAPDTTATFIASSKQGSLYEINLSIDGQDTPVYVTTDGKYIVVDPIPLE